MLKKEGINIAIVGATGAIGHALTEHIINQSFSQEIHAYSRTTYQYSSPKLTKHHIDIENEASIQQAATKLADYKPIDWLIITTGLLHTQTHLPEKSIRDLSSENFHKLYAVNAVGPALVVKYFAPYLAKHSTSKVAILSARVGSISDNRLGGWYAYRASKAAINMIIKNFSIEFKRMNPQSVIMGLHPGTVDSALSKPFQTNVPEGKLFTPMFSAEKLLTIIEQATADDTGKLFAWDGSVIEY